MPDLEYCFYCSCPTGRAGRADDSLYCELCDAGPFCDECYEEHLVECEGEKEGVAT